MIEYGTAAERVARDVALLDSWEDGWWRADREMPDDWWGDSREPGIDVQKLRLSNSDQCIVGQLMGTYDAGVDHIVPAAIDGVPDSDLPEVGNGSYIYVGAPGLQSRRAAWFGLFGTGGVDTPEYSADCGELNALWSQEIISRRAA